MVTESHQELMPSTRRLMLSHPQLQIIGAAMAVLVAGPATLMFAFDAKLKLTNTHCPVMADELAVERFWTDHDGQRFFFCCARCRSRFQHDPEYYSVVLASTLLPVPDEGTTGAARQDGHAHHHERAPSMLRWFGKFHPAAVHFPVAMLIAAAMAELLRAVLGIRWLWDAGRFCAWGGAVGALVAAPLGWFSAGWSIGDDDMVLGMHRWMGTMVVLWSVLSVVMIESVRRRNTTIRRRLALLALVIGAMLVGTVGHFGGMLVFGQEYYKW